MSNKEYFDYSGKCKDWPKNLKKDLDRLIEQKQKEQDANPDNILLGFVLRKKEASKKALEELLGLCDRKK